MCNYKVILVIILAMAGSVWAAGGWDADGNDGNLWSTAVNWDNDAVPTSSDNIVIQTAEVWPVIQTGISAVGIDARLYTTDCSLTMTGGSLTLSGKIIAQGGDTDIYMSGGTLNAKGLWTGNYDPWAMGRMTFNMTGGEVNLADGDGLYLSVAGGSYLGLQLDGGTINTDVINFGGYGMDVAGGTLIIDGDVNSTVASYVTSGYITANNGGGTVLHDYNITNAGKTTVYASGGGSPPSKATTPTPANAATAVDVNDDLFWATVGDANNYNVYFGTSSPGSLIGNQEPNTYNPGTMDANTLYYWRIDANNVYGATTGDVWSFTTAVALPDKVTTPSPANAATAVDANDDLFWATAAGADNYNVYFGTSSPGSLIGNQGPNTYDPGAMDASTTYYWRIDANNVSGATTGDVWSFTTAGDSGPETSSWDSGGGDNLWDTAANWYPEEIPGTGTAVYVANDSAEQPLIDATVTALGNVVRVGGTGLTNTVNMTGGTLTTAGYLIFGEGSGSTATLNISGGTINTYSPWVGNGGDGYINMTGGTINISSESLYISTYGTGDGNIQFDAGTITAPAINMDADGLLDFEGGTLILDGNDIPTVASYISSGYITAYDGGGTVDYDYNITNAGKTTVTGSGGASPPSKATNPAPANAATAVDVNDTLFWTAVAGADDYNVYFGTSSPGSLIGNQDPNTYDPAGAMDANTTYYWRIDPNNEYGTTTGDVWSFTTAVALPGKAANPSPANAATGVDVNDALSWTTVAGADNYNVYFGVASPGTFIGNQGPNTYDPTGAMDANTVYYWRIDANNVSGATTGDVWSFKTSSGAPGKATTPTPANGANSVGLNDDFTWATVADADNYNVYFGTSSPGTFIGNQGPNTYDPGAMDANTIHYWRIDANNASGATTGDVWSFTTANPSGPEVCSWDSGGGDNLWDTAANWSPDGIPGTGTAVYVANDSAEQPLIDATVTALGNVVRVGGSGLSNTVNMTGGTLTTSGYLILGEGSSSTATLNISGGTINTYAPWVANNGDGNINMTGGTINVSSESLYIATYGSGDGNVQLDGGTIIAPAINISTGGLLDLEGGTLILDGNDIPTVSSYISSGYITAYDGGGTVNYDYNVTNAGKTTVTGSTSGLPGKATNPAPANAATAVDVNDGLFWATVADANNYDVYFGTSSPGSLIGNQEPNTYDPAGAMDANTTYYWRIDSNNVTGTTTGDVWSFTTAVALPGKATTPSPANAATAVDVNDALFWATATGADNYNVYFGTSSPGSLIGNQGPNTYDPPGAMDGSTTYYWRIDANNVSGATTGDVWSFTTAAGGGSPPSKATNPSPANAATNTDVNDALFWAAVAGADNYDVYFGTSSPGSFIGNQEPNTYDPPGAMDINTTYYWRIDPNNEYGLTTGDVWSFTTAPPSGLYAPVWECGSFKLEFNPTTGEVESFYKKDDSLELMPTMKNGGFTVWNLDGGDVSLTDVNKTETGALYAANPAKTYSVTLDVNLTPDSNYMTFHITDLVGFPTSENAKLNFMVAPNEIGIDWVKGDSVLCWRDLDNDDAIGVVPLDYMANLVGGTQMNVDWHFLWRRGIDPNTPMGDFAIFVCDANDALNNIGAIEVATGTPHPIYEGEWAKINDWVGSLSCMEFGFGTPTEKAQVVDYFKKSGLGMLRLTQNTWEGSSVNTINTNNFPAGKPDLLKFSRELRNDNILLGLHTGSSGLRPSDSVYVAPIPDSRLAAWGTGTLSSSISDSATTILMTPDEGVVMPTVSQDYSLVRPPVYDAGIGMGFNYIQIGNEIIQVNNYDDGGSPWTLTGCTRGVQGTTAASHSSSAAIKGLLKWSTNLLMIDPDQSIFQEVSDKLSGIANECEIAYIVFDGLEASDAQGWFGRPWFLEMTYNSFDNFVSTNGLLPYFWHMCSTSDVGEPMHTYPKVYFENALVTDGIYVANFFPQNFGWYPLAVDSRNGAWHASTQDEFEWWMAKCAAYDAHYILSTSIAELDAHHEVDTILSYVKKWEKARIEEVFSDAQKTAMEEFDMSFRMTSSDPNSETWSVTPVKVTPAFIEPEDSADVNNVHAAQGLRFEVRVLPSYDYSSGSNVALLPAGTGDLSIDSGLSVEKDGDEWTFSMTNSGDSPSVALQGNDPISTVDLSNKRGMGLYITGDGNGGYFFVEYKSLTWMYRQYFFANDSAVKTYVEIPSTEVSDYFYLDTLNNLVQQAFYTTRQGFHFPQIIQVSFGLIGVPASTSVSVVVEGIKALAETETAMEDLTMSVDGTTLVVDGSVASGNYLVYEGGGTASVLDPDRGFVESLDVNDTGWEKAASESSVTVNCTGATKPWLKVLFKTLGTSFDFSNPNFYATHPTPSYGATNVDPNNVVLSWEASVYAADVNGHDVYLGTSYSAVANADHESDEYLGVFDTNTHTLGSNLDANTTYYWAVDEVNGVDVYIGEIWMFRTFSAPGKATIPNPSNGATGASCGASLTWTADDSATSHDVYFGTVSADVNSAGTGDSEFKGNQAGASYAPGPMSESTTHYWRIDEKNNLGTTKGDLWSFTTGTVPSVMSWTSTGGELWSSTQSWYPVDVPGTTTSVYISNDGSPQPLIDSTVAAYGATTRVGGTGLTNSVTMTGGTWTTSNILILGEGTGGTGTVNISGGTISAYALWISNNGQGIVNMTGGTINQTEAGQSLYIGALGTAGQFNLDAGTVSAKSMTIGSVGNLDIHAGTLILDGDVTSTISSYVSSDYITAYGDTGTVVYDYNTSNAGKTTVTATNP